MVFERFFERRRRASAAKEYAQRERELYARIISIMQRCKTKQQIIGGFREIEFTARRSPNFDLANTAKAAAEGCKSLPIEYVIQLRDDQIRIAEAFLKVTKEYAK